MKNTNASREMKRAERAGGVHAPLYAGWVAAAACAAVMLAWPSCKKDAESDAPGGRTGFKAVAESHSGDEKTIVDVTGDGDNVSGTVKWVKDDRVAVFNGKGVYGQFTAKNVRDDGKTADLEEGGSVYDYDPPYRAVYPDVSLTWNSSNNSVSGLALGETQKYNENLDGANPMAAYAEGPDASGATTLPFKNLCGILRVSLTGAGWTVNSIRITSKEDNDALWGQGTVTFDSGSSANHTLTVENSATGNNVLTLVDCNKALTEDLTAFNLVLPAGTLSNGFTMEVIDDRDRVACRKSVSASASVTPGIRQSVINDMDVVDMRTSTDLAICEDGQYKTANCYIATTGSTDYRFPCYIKGNGVDTNGSTGTANTKISGYKEAAVVWETFNTGVAPTKGSVVSDVKLIGDYVHFKSGTQKGNALIAVYDQVGVNADGTHKGNVLWSWHIWCVDGGDKPRACDHGTTSKDNDVPILMDRALGALAKVVSGGGGDDDPCPAYGLMYQWGRKDPFMGAKKRKNAGSEDFMASTGTFDISGTAGTTIDNAVKAPTTFMIGSSTISNDWLSSPNPNLWTTSTGRKTMYDPCPAGWMVPIGGSNAGNPWCPNGAWSGTSYGTQGGYGWSNSILVGCYATLTAPTTNVESSQFPSSGYRDSSSGTLVSVGGLGYYWSATPNGRYAYCLHFNSSNVYPFSDNFRAYGFCVRPVRE